MIYLLERPNYHLPINHFTYNYTEENHQIAVRSTKYESNKEWCDWARKNGCFPDENEDEFKLNNNSMERRPKEEESGEAEEDKEDSKIGLDEVESSIESKLNIFSTDASETASSCAKIRYSLSDHGFTSLDIYYTAYLNLKMRGSRIAVQDPGSRGPHETVFYFIEMASYHIHEDVELGDAHKSLFSANVPKDCQVDSENRL